MLYGDEFGDKMVNEFGGGGGDSDGSGVVGGSSVRWGETEDWMI